MNLSHLRYITEVAKTGSITKAAQNLYMGQPNLSKAIREMEKTMGVAIFKRTSKGVEPTEKGKEIVERAKALLKSAEDFETDFCNKKDRIEKISVGICGSEYCFGIFEETAIQWIDERVLFEYFRSDRDRIIEQVKNGELSFGVIRLFGSQNYISPNNVGIKRQLLAEGKCLAAISKENTLADKGKISALDIKDMVQVFVSGVQVPENIKNIGVSDTAGGERIIEKNPNCFMAVSFVDVSRCAFEMDKTAYLELEPVIEVKDWLIYSEGKKFSVREKELIERCSRV